MYPMYLITSSGSLNEIMAKLRELAVWPRRLRLAATFGQQCTQITQRPCTKWDALGSSSSQNIHVSFLRTVPPYSHQVRIGNLSNTGLWRNLVQWTKFLQFRPFFGTWTELSSNFSEVIYIEELNLMSLVPAVPLIFLELERSLVSFKKELS